MRWTSLFVAALVLAACGPIPRGSPQEGAPVRVDIPTATAEAQGVTCAGGLYVGPMTLVGNAAARPPVWLVWRGTVVPIVFPTGFYATYEPAVRIHDATGSVVARAGDDLNKPSNIWTGLWVCVSSDVVRVYRAVDVLPASP